MIVAQVSGSSAQPALELVDGEAGFQQGEVLVIGLYSHPQLQIFNTHIHPHREFVIMLISARGGCGCAILKYTLVHFTNAMR